ncbi:MAG: monovalent cation/H+ antiporter complex subunit F [Acidimicrobiales bacterium]
MIALAICGFVVAGLCGTFRLLRGPSLADRIIALDVTLISLMGAITVDAARRDDPTDLILLVVLAIIGFTATVTATQFIETDREPDREPDRQSDRENLR